MAEVKLRTIPEGWEEHDENLMSNFDGIVNENVEKDLINNDLYAGYTAWEFYGSVWYDKEEKLWYCKVMRYHSHVDTISADSPSELRKEVSDIYGYE